MQGKKKKTEGQTEIAAVFFKHSSQRRVETLISFHGGVFDSDENKGLHGEAVDEQGEASGEGGAEKNDKAFEQIDQLFGFLNGLYKNTNRSKELNTETHASSRNKTMVSRPQKNQLQAQIKPEKTKPRVYSDAIDIHNFPIDYSLKDRIRFVSKYSMDWAKYTNYSRYSVPNGTVGGHGKRQHFTWDKLLSTSTSETQKAFAEASKYYVYPAAEIPPAFLSLKTALNRANEVSKSRREGTGQNTKNNPMANTLLTYFQDRKNDWNNALIGLYHQFKSHKIHYFYVHSSSFTILFKHDQVQPGKHANSGETSKDDDCRRFKIVVSPSTRSLRNELRRLQINFYMPHDYNNVDDQEENDLEAFEELKMLEKNLQEANGSRGQTRFRRKG